MKYLNASAAALLILLARSGAPPETVSANQTNYYHGLVVKISSNKSEYMQSEQLTLTVEFRNEGTTTIRVGRAVDSYVSSPFRLSIKIEDSSGRAVLDPPRDLPELPCVDLREPDPQHPRIWAEIAPGAAYTTSLTLSNKTLRPGRYKLEGRYRSYGLLMGGHCTAGDTDSDLNRTAMAPTEIEWKGAVNTNPLWTAILPVGAQH
ncbi:MAG: hypothetical protein WBG02_10090 [Candidatus Acidiferrum sp.]